MSIALKSLLERTVGKAVRPVFDLRHSAHLVVLAYHGICNPQNFCLQLETIRRHRRPIDLDTLIDVTEGRRSMPERALLLTFDDADATLVDYGLPLLEANDVPAVAFVVAGLLGTEEPFWWEEVETLLSRGAIIGGLKEHDTAAIVRHLKTIDDEQRSEILRTLRSQYGKLRSPRRQLRCSDLPRLEAGGIAVGNHSLTHPCLPRCTAEKIQREIKTSHDILTRCLGHEPRSFAYPNGDRDCRVERALERTGYTAAFLFDHRLVTTPVENRFRISRVRVNTSTPLHRFSNILSGFHPFVHHALGRR